MIDLCEQGKLCQVVDETDRLLREAYQSWLPTVLELTQPKDENIYPSVGSFHPNFFSALRTRRRW